MASRLRDFTRVNPPVYTVSKIVEDIEEKCRVAILHDIMDLLIYRGFTVLLILFP